MFKQRTKPKVSIIIPSWFTEDQSGRYGEHETFNIANKCLNRLIEVTPKNLYELIIIDNGSVHFNSEVTNYFAKADITIRNSQNLGFAPAMNQGVNIARGDYLLLLNNDIWVWSGFVENLLEIFNHKELTPPVGGAMPNLIKKEFQRNCLRSDGRLDIIKAMNLEEKDIVFHNKHRYEQGAEFGSTIMMPEKLVKRIKEINGGYELYDERFLLGFGEDRLLFHQIRKLGYQTYRTNQLRILHVGNLSMGKIKDRKQYTTKNRELLKKLKEE